MLRLIGKRFLIMIPQLFALSVFIFILASYMPGDALTGRINPTMSAQRIVELREQMGLNQPQTARYARWVASLLEGDFGVSYAHGLPVTKLVGDKAINSLWLGLFTLLISYCVAVPLGALAGHFQGRLPDKLISAYSYALFAVPVVVFAILHIFLFSFALRLFPSGGSIDVSAGASLAATLLSRVRHVFLPSMTGAILIIPIILQLLRSEWIDLKHSGHVMAARARGLPEAVIRRRHIFPGAAIPVVSLTGTFVVSVLSGMTLIETTFSYPGLGKLFMDAIGARDYPVANFLVMLFAALIVLGTLLSDILLYKLNPRITAG